MGNGEAPPIMPLPLRGGNVPLGSINGGNGYGKCQGDEVSASGSGVRWVEPSLAAPDSGDVTGESPCGGYPW